MFCVKYCVLFILVALCLLEDTMLLTTSIQLCNSIDNIGDVKGRMELLISDLKMWMTRIKLKLNDNKSEILIIRGNIRQ